MIHTTNCKSKFSIIICTYNPNIKVLERLFDAIIGISENNTNIEFETLLIDNNSIPELVNEKVVKDFIKRVPHAKLIKEPIPGLTSARLTGINNAQYEWLVFFDDDNEPASDYLSKATHAIEAFPFVGAWGPGNIGVEYLNGSNKWLQSQKVLFQERNTNATIFESKKEWQLCYPYGTGMIIKKEIALEYVERVNNKRYTLSDRKGKSLSSGGDVQLVLTAIDLQFAAGVIEGMHITHIIDENKANLSYMKKQQYGTSSSYIKAYNQVFKSNPLLTRKATNRQVFLRIYSLFRIHRKKMSNADFQLLLASKLGEINASVIATEQTKPLLLRLFEKVFHV